MKKIQILRSISQIVFLVLTSVSFFINFKVTMLAILLLTLLSGVYYCGWICPFGFIQDIYRKLGNLAGIKKMKVPKPIHKILTYSRYIILFLTVFISTDLLFDLLSLDPRNNFNTLLLGNVTSVLVLVVIVFFALVALFFERPFCNYFCPEGAKYGLISSFRIFTIKRDNNTCVDCKKCDKACPMNIEVSKSNNMKSLQCINCFECVSICPIPGAICYDKVKLDKTNKTHYITGFVILALLLGGFLMYNMSNGANPTERDTTVQIDLSFDSNLPDIDQNSNNTSDNSTNSIDPNSSSTSVNTTTIDTSSNNSNDSTAVAAASNASAVDMNSNNTGDAAGISNGIYTGVGYGFRGAITLEITIKNEEITQIEVVEHREDRRWYNRAVGTIPDSIIDAQSTDVDLVSGATFSSIGIRDAVQDALDNAK